MWGKFHFPTQFFAPFWGTSCSLRILSVIVVALLSALRLFGHVRSCCSLWSENLVAVEDLCQFGSGAKKAAFFASWGVLKFPVSDGLAPKWKVCRIPRQSPQPRV